MRQKNTLGKLAAAVPLLPLIQLLPAITPVNALLQLLSDFIRPFLRPLLSAPCATHDKMDPHANSVFVLRAEACRLSLERHVRTLSLNRMGHLLAKQHRPLGPNERSQMTHGSNELCTTE